MSAFLTLDGGVEFSREEAETLVGLRLYPAWPLLKRVLNGQMSDEASRVMLGSKPPTVEELNDARGRYAALADVIGFVETTFAEKVVAAVAALGDTPATDARV